MKLLNKKPIHDEELGELYITVIKRHDILAEYEIKLYQFYQKSYRRKPRFYKVFTIEIYDIKQFDGEFESVKNFALEKYKKKRLAHDIDIYISKKESEWK